MAPAPFPQRIFMLLRAMLTARDVQAIISLPFFILFPFVLHAVSPWLFGKVFYRTLIYPIYAAAAFNTQRNIAAGPIFYGWKKLNGKTVVLTGGSSGSIGEVCAREFIKMGAKVIVTYRGDKSRGEKLVQSLMKQANTKDTDRVHAVECDLTSFESVRKAAKEIREKVDNRIDLLVLNAGVMMLPKCKLTEDGEETQMQSNALSHYLLTAQLFDIVQKTKGSRIVSVSSLAHAFTPKLDIERQKDSKRYDPNRAYGDSKLANIYFTQELAKKYGARAYAVHPGTVRTNLTQHLPSIAQAVSSKGLFQLTGKSPEDGAKCTLYAALNDNAKVGQYHSDCGVGYTSAAAQDYEAAEKWFKYAEQVTKQSFKAT